MPILVRIRGSNVQKPSKGMLHLKLGDLRRAQQALPQGVPFRRRFILPVLVFAAMGGEDTMDGAKQPQDGQQLAKASNSHTKRRRTLVPFLCPACSNKFYVAVKLERHITSCCADLMGAELQQCLARMQAMHHTDKGPATTGAISTDCSSNSATPSSMSTLQGTVGAPVDPTAAWTTSSSAALARHTPADQEGQQGASPAGVSPAHAVKGDAAWLDAHIRSLLAAAEADELHLRRRLLTLKFTGHTGDEESSTQGPHIGLRGGPPDDPSTRVQDASDGGGPFVLQQPLSAEDLAERLQLPLQRCAVSGEGRG